MKTFENLTTQQREQAIKTAFHAIVEGISSGVLEIELADERSQEKLNKALLKATQNDNRRLATLMVLHDKSIRKEIERLALVAASESMYDKDGNLLKEVKNVDSIQH